MNDLSAVISGWDATWLFLLKAFIVTCLFVSPLADLLTESYWLLVAKIGIVLAVVLLWKPLIRLILLVPSLRWRLYPSCGISNGFLAKDRRAECRTNEISEISLIRIDSPGALVWTANRLSFTFPPVARSEPEFHARIQMDGIRRAFGGAHHPTPHSSKACFVLC